MVEVLCFVFAIVSILYERWKQRKVSGFSQKTILRVSLVALVVAGFFPFIFEVLTAMLRGIEHDTILFFLFIFGVHILHRIVVRAAAR